MSTIRIFISHSSKDVGLAEALVRCLNDCLEVPEAIIRCTSVPGYKLEPGTNTNEGLRENIKNCTIVIGLLTEESLQSGYVIMELGAAWGLEKITCPILTPSVDFKRIPGPLVGTHSIKTDNASDISGLIDLIAEKVDLPHRNRQSFMKAVQTFVATPAAGVTKLDP